MFGPDELFSQMLGLPLRDFVLLVDHLKGTLVSSRSAQPLQRQQLPHQERQVQSQRGAK